MAGDDAPVPQCTWQCKPYCDAPEDSIMTCDQCLDGIRASINQLVEPQTIEDIITFLQVRRLLPAPSSLPAG